MSSTQGNISAKYLAEHRARMTAWRQGEVHLLVKEQDSAVKAVRLERLVGDIGQDRRRAKIRDDTSSKLSGSASARSQEYDDEDESELEMSETEKRRILFLTETPRPWLSPFYNK